MERHAERTRATWPAPLAVASIVMMITGLIGEAGATFAGANGAIAFSRNDEICLVEPDGTGMRNLTRSTEHEVQPAFSPGGDLIAFVRLTGDLYGDVVLMGADGSTPRIIALGSFSHPSFSPDGTRVVAAQHGPEAGLVTFALDGTDRRRLTNPAGDLDTAPSWSPDGARIVFQRNTGAGNEIFTIDPSTLAESRLTDNTVDDSNPSWSPDGSRILFQRDFDIYSMSPDGGSVTRLTADPVATPGVDPTRHMRSDPVFSPDGTAIVFVRDGELWTASASGGSESRLTARTGSHSDLNPDWQPLPETQPASVRTAGSSTPPPDAEPTDESCRPESHGSPTPSPSPSQTQDGDVVRVSSRVSISYDGRAFRGKVDSDDPRCEEGRKVLLKREARKGDETVGKDRTGDRGRWRIRDRDADGRYYARATRRKIGSGPTAIVCRRATSNEVVEVIGVQPAGDRQS